MKRANITMRELQKYIDMRNERMNRELQYTDAEMEKYLDQIEAENIENVSHNRPVVKIIGDYWEFMKKQMEQHDEVLTSEEALYISRQIDLEFYPEYLKSMINERWAQ
jgi:site-specific recombinase XerD